ncbi:hypothetical protein BS50DRAFT_37724 [Corynespora cassiicola Philippines]|uniref:Uncharacterized protein n=1 Tax=Corynespora cassiicola Philippines TaxID=1448308 RepID=A0A2T2PCD1_CORCC|nr:hypothetical protein BS50DRAFT_37724 [Corynespora cassiicola Philippines]
MDLDIATSLPLSPVTSNNNPLSPSLIPELALLPHPLAAQSLPVGQLVSKTSKHNPSALEDRDYDDIGTRWYKDVIIFNEADGRFVESLGGTHLVQKKLETGAEVGTIEAEEQRVRLLKDPVAAFNKVLQEQAVREWLKGNKEAGFVVAKREVTNANYKRARLVDVGNGNFEVIREVGGEGKGGKRRDSGLEVQTNSKRDVVGVVTRKIVVNGDEFSLGDEELGADFWN